MTTPYERTRATIETNLFLHALLDPNLTPRVSASVRETARKLVRHYPSYSNIEAAHKALPHLYAPVPTFAQSHGKTVITALGLDKIGSKK